MAAPSMRDVAAEEEERERRPPMRRLDDTLPAAISIVCMILVIVYLMQGVGAEVVLPPAAVNFTGGGLKLEEPPISVTLRAPGIRMGPPPQSPEDKFWGVRLEMGERTEPFFFCGLSVNKRCHTGWLHCTKDNICSPVRDTREEPVFKNDD